MNYFSILFLIALNLTPLFNTGATGNLPTKETSKSSPIPKKLIFAIDVIRHGDRYPTINIPNASYYPLDDLGQLTPLGMKQEYELGKKLRHRYVTQEHLLPSSYHPKTLYIRSGDSDRTLMSAQSLLTGLYPPGTGPLIHFSSWFKQEALPYHIQPIPIHTVPKDKDGLLLPENNVIANFHDAEVASVFSTPEWKHRETQLKSHYHAWSQATGVNLNSELQLGLLADALFINNLKHKPLPKGLSQQEATMIIDGGRWGFLTIFQNQKIGKTFGTPLLEKITEALQEAAQHKTALKYTLYSGHDTTILILLGAMGVTPTSLPGYASDLNFSLYQQGKDSFVVQVTYNGKLLSLSSKNDPFCSLEKFVALSAHPQKS